MTATPHALELARIAVAAATGKLASEPIVFDVSDHLAITDLFVVVSASNERQVGAIVDAVEERLLAEAGEKPSRREGDRVNRWVLLDYLDLVVHVMHAEERETYSLERLWHDAPKVDLGSGDAATGKPESLA